MPIHVVAARLGHDPATLLRVYAQAGDDSQDAAAGLEGLLDGERPPLRVVPAVDDEADEPEALTRTERRGFVTTGVTAGPRGPRPCTPDLRKRSASCRDGTRKNRF